MSNFGGSGQMGMMSGGGGSGGAGGAIWKMWDTIDEQRKYDRSRRDAKYFQNRQFEYQKMLDKYGHDLQFDMWNKTNYKAQLEHMKAAGLNPALMYGSAGAPGTTGSQGGGSAAGGQKPDSGAQGNFSMLTAQAQIDMMQSQANKNNAEAEAISGYQKGESEARTGKLGKEVEEINARIKNLSEEKKRIIATTSKEVSEKEKIDVVTDIRKIDKNYFKEHDLAPSDYGIIKGLKRIGVDLYDAVKWIINVSPEEARKVISFGWDDWRNKNN